MVKRPRARGPDHTSTPLMRAVALMKSEDPRQRVQGFGQVFDLTHERVSGYVERSLRTHSPKYSVYYLVKNHIDAHVEEVCHGVWVVVIHKGPLFTCDDPLMFDDNFYRWLSSISYRKSREYLGGLEHLACKNELLDGYEGDESDEEDERHAEQQLRVGGPHSLEEELIHNERMASLIQAIFQLKPEDRELAIRRFVLGYSYQELIALTGQTYGALRAKVCRIRANLRDALQ